MAGTHTFHIPVLGIGFSIDSSIKVSRLGINSVMSLVDDILIERMRKVYSSKYKIPYEEITNKIEDFRAKRITSYLNMVNKISEEKIAELKSGAQEKIEEIKEYFSLFPDGSQVKKEFNDFMNRKKLDFQEFKNWLSENISMGSIDVNIMTKVDKDNFRKGEQLPVEYNDAHAALRGFAKSDLKSSIILSAGMNPRLYNYIERFVDFYPNVNGEVKKKIVLKVSDYRSALIQGLYFAKKGIWVSEYRIESGLNCGGHAFASDGYLMGPVLDEFKQKRNELIDNIGKVLINALETKGKIVPRQLPKLLITAQGGVGTSQEHEFLLDHYGMDSIGWGTPFLMVPEAVSIDEETIDKLAEAKEEDLYLSDISPLGVPFNSLKGNTKDIERMAKIATGKPGSTCPKQYIALNNEYTEKSICTASSRYQRIAIKELDNANLPIEEYQNKYNKIVEKSCICVGLSTATLKINKLDYSVEGAGVSVCPGPNMAYFSRKLSLKEIVGHIYGRVNVINRDDRPNIFVKELGLYLDYLGDKIDEGKNELSKRQEKYLVKFARNLDDGIEYYNNLFGNLKDDFEGKCSQILNDLKDQKSYLDELILRINNLKVKPIAIRV